eukprot:189477-Hanusia_phi.AAC.2
MDLEVDKVRDKDGKPRVKTLSYSLDSFEEQERYAIYNLWRGGEEEISSCKMEVKQIAERSASVEHNERGEASTRGDELKMSAGHESRDAIITNTKPKERDSTFYFTCSELSL